MFNGVESRKESRIKAKDKKCFCKVDYEHWYVGAEAELLDVSESGARLKIAYKPNINEVIQLSRNYTFKDKKSSDVDMVVKWFSQVDKTVEEAEFEVGCEVKTSVDNTQKSLGNFNNLF